jgi:4-aminobutyrate aminotransferase-like enzyme
MRDRGVLVGSTGPDRATMKIRPPLLFGDDHAALLLEALDSTLRAGR